MLSMAQKGFLEQFAKSSSELKYEETCVRGAKYPLTKTLSMSH